MHTFFFWAMWLTYTVYLFPIDGNSVLRFECVKVSKPFLWCSIIACTKHHKVYHCGSMICFGRMAIVLTLAVATFDSVRESAPEYPIMERSHCSNFGSDPTERSITNWTPQYQYSYWMDLVMDFFHSINAADNTRLHEAVVIGRNAPGWFHERSSAVAERLRPSGARPFCDSEVRVMEFRHNGRTDRWKDKRTNREHMLHDSLIGVYNIK